MHPCSHHGIGNIAPATEAGLLRIVTSALNRALDAASPAEIIDAAVHSVPRGKLAVVSSFGTESAVLLKHVADVDRSLPVLFLDTGWLFPETLAYRDTLVARLGLTDVRTIRPENERGRGAGSRRGPVVAQSRRLLQPAQGRAACSRASGVRRLDQRPQALPGRQRAARCRWSRSEGSRLKFNPLAQASPAELGRRVREARSAPPSAGASRLHVGRLHAVHERAARGRGPRAGRWRGRGKTECGIHSGALPVAERARTSQLLGTPFAWSEG